MNYRFLGGFRVRLIRRTSIHKKSRFPKSTVLSAIAILLFSAVLTPFTTEITKYVNGRLSGISYSIPPDSLLTSEDIIKLEIRNAKYLMWSWDDDLLQTAKGSIANINPPSGKGIHVLKFQQLDSDPKTKTKTYNNTAQKVNYTVLADAPTLELSPQKTQFKPGETITIKAADKDGIYDIGWAWGNDQTKQELSDDVKITVPDTPGDYILGYYARDNTKEYTRAGWFRYRINVTTDSTITTNNMKDTDSIKNTP